LEGYFEAVRNSEIGTACSTVYGAGLGETSRDHRQRGCGFPVIKRRSTGGAEIWSRGVLLWVLVVSVAVFIVGGCASTSVQQENESLRAELTETRERNRALEDEINELQSTTAELEGQVKELRRQITQLTSQDLKITFLEDPVQYRVVMGDTELLAMPRDGAPVLDTVKKGTVVKVEDLAQVEGDGMWWFYVSLPTLSDVNRKGWISAGRGVFALSDGTRDSVRMPVTLKAGITVHGGVEKDDSITLQKPVEMAAIVERDGDLVMVEGSGGASYWVAESDISYPPMEYTSPPALRLNPQFQTTATMTKEEIAHRLMELRLEPLKAAVTVPDNRIVDFRIDSIRISGITPRPGMAFEFWVTYSVQTFTGPPLDFSWLMGNGVRLGDNWIEKGGYGIVSKEGPVYTLEALATGP